MLWVIAKCDRVSRLGVLSVAWCYSVEDKNRIFSNMTTVCLEMRIKNVQMEAEPTPGPSSGMNVGHNAHSGLGKAS